MARLLTENPGMTESEPTRLPPCSERTAWARHLETPLRQFLRTETGSAVVLLAATIAALVWANVSTACYDSVWDTRLSVQPRQRRACPRTCTAG